MIRNHSITYEAIESPLTAWKVGDPILHSFLVAFVTTVLSYQLTAIVFDLLVGFKPTGRALVTDLTTVILSQESSLLSAAANMFQNITLWRWRYWSQRLDIPAMESQKAVITLPVRLKFCTLFCIAPILLLLAVILSIETDSIMTFEDVKFGGIALGFNQNQSLDSTRENKKCLRYRVGHTDHEVVTASFHFCSDLFNASGSILNTTTLSISKTPREEILIRLEDPNNRFDMLSRVDVRIFKQIYRLRARVSQNDGRGLMKHGYSVLSEACQTGSSQQPVLVSSDRDFWNISQVVPCSPESTAVSTMFADFHSSITVVDADDFGLIPTNELRDASVPNDTSDANQFVTGGNLAFLKRRRSMLSFPVLCIVATIAMVVRILLKCLATNDTEAGIESIVKAALGVESCSSMFQKRAVVDSRQLLVDKTVYT